MKLKRATYRHIEAEIYAYYDTLQAIKDLRRDIILAGRHASSWGSAGSVPGGPGTRRGRFGSSVRAKYNGRLGNSDSVED
jgi:hypothetical protein